MLSFDHFFQHFSDHSAPCWPPFELSIPLFCFFVFHYIFYDYILRFLQQKSLYVIVKEMNSLVLVNRLCYLFLIVSLSFRKCQSSSIDSDDSSEGTVFF